MKVSLLPPRPPPLHLWSAHSSGGIFITDRTFYDTLSSYAVTAITISAR